MKRQRIHLIYEHGPDGRPFGSAYIRLLRPLTHPGLQDMIEVSYDLNYQGQKVDAVIVDRLWRPDVSPDLAHELLKQIHAFGARLIYALDDNFLALPEEKKDWETTDDRLEVVKIFLTEADGLIVTTPALKERFATFNSKIVVVPNALDERLLSIQHEEGSPKARGSGNSFLKFLHRFRPKRKCIGYMGTLTHDDDLLMILPALEVVAARHKLELQFVGAIRQVTTRQALKKLPARIVHHKLKKIEYPEFMPWFSQLRWDIAIAPLRDTAFNRCKSDVKFLDYCAVGAAGIYSCVPAYQTTVRHLETGWLAENTLEAWIEALERLLVDDQLREQIAHRAVQYLMAERVVERCSHQWRNALNTLLDL